MGVEVVELDFRVAEVESVLSLFCGVEQVKETWTAVQEENKRMCLPCRTNRLAHIFLHT